MTGRAIVLRGDAAHLPLPDGSVHAVVCDPPYGLEFMGREWDTFKTGDGFRRSRNEADAGRGNVFGRTSRTSPEYITDVKPSAARIRERVDGRTNPASGKSTTRTPEAYVAGSTFQRWCEAWARECLRVLRPGGYLLAFGGTRTWHRLVCGLEDAGFEIRESVADLTGYDAPGLMWTYGSGFPKSLDVSKAIDKRGGNAHLGTEIGTAIKAAREARGWTAGRADQHFCGGSTNWTWYEGRKGICRPPAPADFACIVAEWPELAPLAEKVDEVEREIVSHNPNHRDVSHRDNSYPMGQAIGGKYVSAPATDEAARWEGWGTALKPGWEPIAVARKPLAGTVAQNVLAYGTGAINVAGCRVAHASEADRAESEAKNRHADFGSGAREHNGVYHGQPAADRAQYDGSAGRWPPNVLLSDEAAAEMDRQSGASTSRIGQPRASARPGDGYGMTHTGAEYADEGGASRFFPVFRYEAKADASERPRLPDGTAWPTVKPVALMRWLVRLVTPPGGTVLDPFCGTGPTGEAAIIEGFNAVLADKDPQAIALTRVRLAKPIQPLMFAPEPAAGQPQPEHAASAQDSLFDLGESA